MELKIMVFVSKIMNIKMIFGQNGVRPQNHLHRYLTSEDYITGLDEFKLAHT